MIQKVDVTANRAEAVDLICGGHATRASIAGNGAESGDSGVDSIIRTASIFGAFEDGRKANWAGLVRLGFLNFILEQDEFWLIGIELERLGNFGLRTFNIAGFEMGFGEQVMGLGVARLLFQGRSEKRFRIAPAFLLQCNDAKIIERALVLWIDLERCPVK